MSKKVLGAIRENLVLILFVVSVLILLTLWGIMMLVLIPDYVIVCR